MFCRGFRTFCFNQFWQAPGLFQAECSCNVLILFSICSGFVLAYQNGCFRFVLITDRDVLYMFPTFNIAGLCLRKIGLMPMSKLPKSLSLNSRTRSTSTANRSLPWDKRIAPRSGTAIVRSLMDTGPREIRTYDQQITTLLDRIRREQNRIKKLQAGVRTPEKEHQLVVKEGHVNRMIFNLQVLNAKKQEADKRELSKFANNPKGQEYVGQADGFVRLEKGKVVPKKQTVLVDHRLKPLASRKLPTHKELEIVHKQQAAEARKERLRRMSVMELYEHQKEEGLHSPEAQKTIEEAFQEIQEISEEDFEKMMNGE